jgi:protoheme IX farnesyltransferase
MKAVATSTANAVTVAAVEPPAEMSSRVADWMELVKVRLSGLVLLTTLSGFYLASRGAVDWLRLFNTLIGTALLAFGASALNQFQERHLDARMKRTAHRPLPAGRMAPPTALWFGVASAAAGFLYLALMVNWPTSLIGAATLLTYNLIYTPLKRVTWLNTLIGAVPGATPPVMGWSAARNDLSPEGWTLFAILFLWQIPHFMAIAWLYRDDYARGGFIMLPQVDASGRRTGRQAVGYTLGLLAASVCPALLGLVGAGYLVGAVVLGLAFLAVALRFSRDMTRQRTLHLFFMSILYLPLLLGLLVIDKVKP